MSSLIANNTHISSEIVHEVDANPLSKGITICYDEISSTIYESKESRSIPGLFTPLTRLCNACGGKKTELCRIYKASGIIKPGTMTLILAPSGHGKTSLLKLLSDRLPVTQPREDPYTTSYFAQNPSILYNGYSSQQLQERGFDIRKMIAYVSQCDIHFAFLTVEETLLFACRMTYQAPLSEQGMAAEDITQFIHNKVENIIQLLGLDHCRHTIVGDRMIRGISGGEMRRVTLGECLVTNAKVLCLDHYTDGLDAAVAESITRQLRKWCVTEGNTIVAALQQPTPSLFHLFDNIIVLREGHVVYNGPRDDILSYFASMGFRCPDDVDVCDYIIDVLLEPTEALQRQLSVDGHPDQPPHTTSPSTHHPSPLRMPSPCITLSQMTLHFQQSEYYQALLRQIHAMQNFHKMIVWTAPLSRSSSSSSLSSSPETALPASTTGAAHTPEDVNHHYHRRHRRNSARLLSYEEVYSEGVGEGASLSPALPAGLPSASGISTHQTLHGSGLGYGHGHDGSAFSLPDTLDGLDRSSLSPTVSQNASHKKEHAISIDKPGKPIITECPASPQHAQPLQHSISTTLLPKAHHISHELDEDHYHGLLGDHQQQQHPMRRPSVSSLVALSTASSTLLLSDDTLYTGGAPSTLAALGHVIRRQTQLVFRNRFIMTFRLLNVVIIGILLGTLYYRLPTTPEYLFQRTSIVGLMLGQFGFFNMSDMLTAVRMSNVAKKQFNAQLYPYWHYTVSLILVSIPQVLGEAVLCSSLLYFLTNFTIAVKEYLIFFSIAFLTSLNTSLLLRLVSAFTTRESLAGALAVPITGLALCFSGVIVTKSTMPVWMQYIMDAFPYAWSVRAILNNEFLSSRYDEITPDGKRLGHVYLESSDIPIGRIWIIYCVIYMLAMCAVYFCLHLLILRANQRYFTDHIGTRRYTTATRGDDGEDAGGATSTTSPSPTALLNTTAITVLDSTGCHTEDDENHHSSGQACLQTLHQTIPFTPCVLTFEDISYTIDLDSTHQHTPASSVDKAVAGAPPQTVEPHSQSFPQKQLLTSISGCVQPGTLCVLVGASGSGKSTLLDILSQRKTTGRMDGTVRINGVPIDCDPSRRTRSTMQTKPTTHQDNAYDTVNTLASIQTSVSDGSLSPYGDNSHSERDGGQDTLTSVGHLVGYVEQLSTLFSYETVYEALLFVADLKLPSTTSRETKKQIIEEILDVLQLHQVRNCIIGDAFTRGLSASYMKLVSLGVELISNPSILYLDEPTTGLSSHDAEIVMKACKRVSQSGRTLVCTIHQPSAELFYLFDSMLLLSQNGNQLYFGPLGPRSKTFIQYFQSCEGVPAIPDRYNPCTWMLELIGGHNEVSSRIDNALLGNANHNAPTGSFSAADVHNMPHDDTHDDLGTGGVVGVDVHMAGGHHIHDDIDLHSRTSHQSNISEMSRHSQAVSEYKSKLTQTQRRHRRGVSTLIGGADGQQLMLDGDDDHRYITDDNQSSLDGHKPLPRGYSTVGSLSHLQHVDSATTSDAAAGHVFGNDDFDATHDFGHRTLSVHSLSPSTSRNRHTMVSAADDHRSSSVLRTPLALTTSLRYGHPSNPHNAFINDLIVHYKASAFYQQTLDAIHAVVEQARGLGAAFHQQYTKPVGGPVPARHQYSVNRLEQGLLTDHLLDRNTSMDFTVSPSEVSTTYACDRPSLQQQVLPMTYSRSTLYQFYRLLGRRIVGSYRNPGYNFTRLLLIALVSALSCLLFPRITIHDIPSAVSSLSSKNLCVTFSAIIFTATTSGILFEERGVEYRERARCYYRSSLWFLSTFIIEAIWAVAAIVLMLPSFMFINNINPVELFTNANNHRMEYLEHIAMFLLVAFLGCLVFLAMTCFFYSVSQTDASSAIFKSLYYILFLNLSGVFVPQNKLPSFYRYIMQGVPTRYLTEALIMPLFKNNMNPITIIGPNGEHITVPIRQFVADYLGWEYGHFIRCITILSSMVGGVFILTLIASTFLQFQKR